MAGTSGATGHEALFPGQTHHHLKERVHDFVMMPRLKKIALFSGSVVFSAVIVGLVLLQQPSSWSVGYTSVDGKVRSDSGIAFSFSRPMSRNVDIRIEPDIDGNWFFEDRLSRLHLSREFRFEPVETWLPDTEYTITFDGLRGIFDIGEPAQNVAYTFTTQASPRLTALLPEESESISPQAQFVVQLDSPNAGLAEFSLRIEPEVDYAMTVSDDLTEYTFAPKHALAQGTRYSASVVKNAIRTYRDTQEVSFEGEDEIVATASWKVKEAPGVVDFSPTGSSVFVDEAIAIVLSEPALEDELGKIAIDPEIGGTWSVVDNSVSFEPAVNLAYDQTYQVTIPKGFTTKDGGYLQEDAQYSFTTIGALKVASMSPSPGAGGVAVDRQIRVDFDQPPNHDSAQSKFSIEPSINGAFSWDGSTMIFTPEQNLAMDTGYTVRLGAGIASAIGLPSNREYAFTFSTQPTVVKLDVPYDHQDRALSCEVAALKMALAYKGVSVSEDQLMQHVGYDSTPHEGNVWGNPYHAFVGDINGKQSTTGYGVYWEPIMRAARVYRSADYFVNGTVQRLAEEISNGNPVVVWGNAGTGKRVDWYTPDGQLIYAFNGEHARTVKGFRGSKDNPTHIIVNDPLYGEVTYTTQSFEANWGMLFKAGVVVR